MLHASKFDTTVSAKNVTKTGGGNTWVIVVGEILLKLQVKKKADKLVVIKSD